MPSASSLMTTHSLSVMCSSLFHLLLTIWGQDKMAAILQTCLNFFLMNEISLKFVSKGSINKIARLVQVMAWCQPGNKPLSEPMMIRLPMNICVTRPQWVNDYIWCFLKITYFHNSTEHLIKYCIILRSFRIFTPYIMIKVTPLCTHYLLLTKEYHTSWHLMQPFGSS